MNSKRKHVTLSLKQKCEILDKLECGESVTKIAKDYGVGKSTVCDINKKKSEIRAVVSKSYSGVSKRKTLKLGGHPEVEESLYMWFLQQRSRGCPISGDILAEKAKFFFNNFFKKDDTEVFNASKGWLDKFKRRYGIRFLSMTGESNSCNEDAYNTFKKTFENLLKNHNFTADQVYNADESGLYWRLIPTKTFVSSLEETASGRKLPKDRITFLPCANASGSHKLKLCIIGKSKHPRAFKNFILPCKYYGQPSAWMTADIFRDWFHNQFVPQVITFLKSKNLPLKAMLLLDNAPGHPDLDDLKSNEGEIFAVYLPPNVTALCQPMDQHVIQNVKIKYKKKILHDIVASDDDIATSIKKINLKDVAVMLSDVWSSIPEHLLMSSWKKLWPGENVSEDQGNDVDNIASLDQLQAEINCKLPQVSFEEIADWVNNPEEQVCSENLDDAEIVQRVTRQNECEDAEPSTSQVSLVLINLS